MNPVHAIHRLACVLAGLAAAFLTTIAAAPTAFAVPPPDHSALRPVQRPPLPPGWNKHPPLPAHVHALVTSGMPGWQITLIAAGATALAAAVVTLLARARGTRRATASAA